MRRTTIVGMLVALLAVAMAAPAVADSGGNTSEVRDYSYAITQYRQGCDEMVYITGTRHVHVVIRTNASGTSWHHRSSWDAQGVGLSTGEQYDVVLNNTSMSSGHYTTKRVQSFPAQWNMKLVPEDGPPQVFHYNGITVFHDYGTADERITAEVWHTANNC